MSVPPAPPGWLLSRGFLFSFMVVQASSSLRWLWVEEGTLRWGAGPFLRRPRAVSVPICARSWWGQHSSGPPWEEALQAAAPAPHCPEGVHACVCTRVSLRVSV